MSYLQCKYLQDLFNERGTDYDMRNSFGKLTLPRPRTDYLKCSFSYCGALFIHYLKTSEKLTQLRNSRRKSIACLNRRILTRQSCKTVYDSF